MPELIKQKGELFEQDNAKPYTSLVPRQKLSESDWYATPIIFWYYHTGFFRSFQNSLYGKTSSSNERVRNLLGQLSAKTKKNYIVIMPTIERWQKVGYRKGEYLIPFQSNKPIILYLRCIVSWFFWLRRSDSVRIVRCTHAWFVECRQMK